jgi:hypothetical protein
VLDDAGGPTVKIIAQIDCGDAVRACDEILDACDGIMVSRINLGMDIPASKASAGSGQWGQAAGRLQAVIPWPRRAGQLARAPRRQAEAPSAARRAPYPQVPLAQKWLIQKANLVGKPAFVAGQVMEGMATNVRPSRPEITDIVNAVYDGADGLVLMQVRRGRCGGCWWRPLCASPFQRKRKAPPDRKGAARPPLPCLPLPRKPPRAVLPASACARPPRLSATPRQASPAVPTTASSGGDGLLAAGSSCCFVAAW